MSVQWCHIAATFVTVVVNVVVTMLNQKKNESLLFPAKSTAPLASKAAPPKQKTVHVDKLIIKDKEKNIIKINRFFLRFWQA